MDKDFFYKGETVEEFIAGFGENRPRFEQLLMESTPSEEQSRQAKVLPHDLCVMVIAEPWSGDVMYNLPPLIRLAEAAGWELRIFHRDQFPDLILPYRKDGLYRSIPVCVFYDRDFNELSHWIERPAEATRVIEEESLKLRRRLREEHKIEWRNETISEWLKLIKRVDEA